MSRGRGRWKNLGVVTLGPEAAKVRNYITVVKKRVGWARAGWNLGIASLGGNLRASWYGRHGFNRGTFVDGRMTPDPFIKVANDTSWAKHGSLGEGNRILQNAINSRARDMQAYYFRMMKLAAEKSGARVTIT